MPGVPEPGGRAERPLTVRLVWFGALWLAGVASVGLLALLIRAVLPA
jgi:hypothetical protein